MSEHPAIESLRKDQGQLDEDGVCVAVSRQAVDETLAIFDEMRTALKNLLRQSEKHIFSDECRDERNAARAAIARAEGSQ